MKEAARLYRNGLSMRDISITMEVNKSTIYDWLTKQGVPRRHKGQYGRTKLSTIALDIMSGLSLKEIAHKRGYASLQSFSTRMYRAGLHVSKLKKIKLSDTEQILYVSLIDSGVHHDSIMEQIERQRNEQPAARTDLEPIRAFQE